MFIYSLKITFENGKKISLNKSEITIGNDTFLKSDIEKIISKKKFKIKILFQYYEMEGIKITLKNSKEYIIFDDYYENLWQLKNFLQIDVNSNEDINHNFSKINSPIKDIDSVNFQEYKGLPIIFTFNGLFALFFFVFGMILLSLTNGFIFPVIFGIFFILFSIYLFSTFHTFYLSKNYLLIKKFYQLKNEKIYKIDEIQEIVFEQQSRSPITLRVITKNFLSIPYPATSLRKKDWKILKNELEKKNIYVRVNSVELWDI